MQKFATRLIAVAALFLSTTAIAQIAWTTQSVNVRAGPDRSFPLVTWLRPGTAVNVIGCLPDWRWCDVVAGFNRGWVFGNFLGFGNQRIPIINGGARWGVPTITFTLGSYWDTHYVGRSWNSNRNQWNNWRPPPPRPPAVRPQPPRPPSVRPPPPRPQPPIARPPGRPPQSGRPPGSGQGSGRPPGSGQGSGRPPGGGQGPGGPPVARPLPAPL